MSGAVLVAVAAAIGNLLQGWDNATIAGKSTLSTRTWRVSIALCLPFFNTES